MRDMGIYYDQIEMRMKHLNDTLEHCGNRTLNTKEKQAVSEQLAELVLMIRLKYGLVSFYYTPAESKAETIVSAIYDNGGFAEAPGMFADKGD